MNSKELFKESKKYLPGGVDSPVRAFKPNPFFVERAKGSKIWDVDGNLYIDHCLAYGPLILGHCNSKIIEDVYKQIQNGSSYGAPTENEITLAKMVIGRVPCAEMVRFVNSGTEATMSAIRLARGYTQKNKIIKFSGSYHGAHDYVLVKSGSGAATLPDSLGIPEDTTKNTLSVPFNDQTALSNLIAREKDEIAAIIVEPVMGNIGCVEPKEGFLEFLREITEKNNIILIFDEVITGFRLSVGGAQTHYSVTPDLVTFGKILGGGYPIGAFAGKRELMEMIAPSGSVYQAGTFNGNPVSVAAGISALNQLDHSFYNELNKKGDYLRNQISETIYNLDLNLQTVGLSSMFQIYFNENPILNYEDAKKSDTEKFLVYFRELMKNGVFIPPSQFECNFISNAHNYEDLEKVVIAIENSLKIAWNK
ncbi:glutamate-1-semialdehyde 2,1-aminomutase [Methanobrevibacter cuticularis]|uniref:Glutamate-1-semialdehyde 2,1-aminomutase n=1 Tax=Methanobrevibacter cuticularis TaxID=47311 RepID=A0A166E293_9EURY|nr:glutamate-1-semialdehyde 2,1-aminomutase [Methanobrevibacter cuticularis]KZX16200.1 glutamate-1-semialdehyde 2,1-aminomutase [Methanobrevibacter cuticularis]